jgi:DNA-binding response OmpR family regulator
MTHADIISSAAANAETLLVVEDEILIRLAICDYLRECGFRVIEATSADEAKMFLQEPNLNIDIVLGAVGMPGTIDGFGLSQWLRTHKPGVPIILVGSPSGAVDAAAALCESGPALSTPYDPQILLNRIKRMLAGRNAATNYAPASGSCIASG